MILKNIANYHAHFDGFPVVSVDFETDYDSDHEKKYIFPLSATLSIIEVLVLSWTFYFPIKNILNCTHLTWFTD